MYKKEFPEDHADIKITALTIEGRTVMPAFAMPTTKGEEPAPAPPDVKRESSEGQIIPIAITERT